MPALWRLQDTFKRAVESIQKKNKKGTMASALNPGPAPPAKIVVLISGSGTNLQALIDATKNGQLPNAQIVRVISDRKDAYGLKRAAAAGIPTTHLGILPFKKSHPDDDGTGEFAAARRAYDAALARVILEGAGAGADSSPPQLVVCAGFMRIVTEALLAPLQGAGVPIINLHPALHGDLVGAHCIERAWAEFEQGTRTKTGIMVHYVITEVDKGEPIVQQEVEITGCKSVEELQERIHAAEHPLIVKGTRIVVEKARP